MKTIADEYTRLILVRQGLFTFMSSPVPAAWTKLEGSLCTPTMITIIMIAADVMGMTAVYWGRFNIVKLIAWLNVYYTCIFSLVVGMYFKGVETEIVFLTMVFTYTGWFVVTGACSNRVMSMVRDKHAEFDVGKFENRKTSVVSGISIAGLCLSLGIYHYIELDPMQVIVMFELFAWPTLMAFEWKRYQIVKKLI